MSEDRTGEWSNRSERSDGLNRSNRPDRSPRPREERDPEQIAAYDAAPELYE